MSIYRIQKNDIHKYYTACILFVMLVTNASCSREFQETPRKTNAASSQITEPGPSVYVTKRFNSSLVRFIDLTEGAVLRAEIDPVTNLPVARILVESKDSRLPLGLEADGILVAIGTALHRTIPYQTELQWTPWHGNGRYVLNLQLLDRENATIPSAETLVVTIAGIPDNAPTIKSKFTQLYQEQFGLLLQDPVFARYNKIGTQWVEDSRWVSVAYIGDYVYEIDLVDDGAIVASFHPLNSDNETGFCRPSGKIRMLAVIVDYDNTGLDPVEVVETLQTGLAEAQTHWVAVLNQNGPSKPIWQVELTTFIYGSAPQRGRYLTPDEIMSADGPNPADFDLLVEIDLDKENTITREYDGVGVSFGDGCRPSGSRRTNIAFNIRDRNALVNSLSVSLFQHELMHSMGWMHWWPNQRADGQSWVNSARGWEPSLLFGWVDVDGDGIIEILDPTPYGLIQ